MDHRVCDRLIIIRSGILLGLESGDEGLLLFLQPACPAHLFHVEIHVRKLLCVLLLLDLERDHCLGLGEPDHSITRTQKHGRTAHPAILVFATVVNAQQRATSVSPDGIAGFDEATHRFLTVLVCTAQRTADGIDRDQPDTEARTFDGCVDGTQQLSPLAFV